MARVTEIVARLQLRAEQFSSESGKQFADLAARAKKASGDVRREFAGTFAEVQRTAQTALQLPRTSGGGLDLSLEIAQLKAQEAAAQNSAQAQRELAAAAQLVSAKGGETAASQRLIADAAMVAERASEEEAAAIRRKINAYEELQKELGQTASGTRQLTQEERQLSEMSGAARAGLQQIGQQATDFVVQVMSGQSALTAFSQQFPQAVGALSLFAESGKSASSAVAATGDASQEAGVDAKELGEKITGVAEKVENTGTRFGKVAAFLSGPWGAALTIATVVAVPFIGKLFESSEAADEAAKKLQAATSAADSYGAAQQLLGGMIDLTTGKLKTQNQVLIQSIKLQAQANLLAANKKIDELTGAKDKPLVAAAAGQAGQMGNAGGDIDAAIRASAAIDQQQAARDRIFERLKAAVANEKLAGADPSLYAKQVGADLSIALGQLDQLAVNGKVAGQSLVDVKAKFTDLAKTATDKAAALQVISVAGGGPIPDELKPYKRAPKPKKPKKERDYSRADDSAEQMIASINAEWDDQPRLIDRARVETLRLDNLIAQLEKRKITPEVARLIGLAKEAKENIQEGLDRPYREFVKAQRESLEVGKLVLGGRDAEAEALQNILRLQDQGKQLTDEQIQSVYRLAQQHQAITRALEDQRRIVGTYETAWGGVLDEVDSVFAKIQGNAGGVVGVVQKLQRNLLENALFGGIDREIEGYIRKMTGKQTPAEILEEQAKGAGSALATSVATASSRVESFADAMLDAELRIRGYSPALARQGIGIAATSFAQYMGGGGYSANDNDIVVTNRKLVAALQLGDVKATDVAQRAIQGILDRAESAFGIKLPEAMAKGLKEGLPKALGGASIFSMIGQAGFGSTGGKIGQGIGAIAGQFMSSQQLAALGPYAALYSAYQSFAQPLAKKWELSPELTAVGGPLLPVIGKLFGIGPTTPRGSAQISSIDGAAIVNGTSGAIRTDLGNLAGSVQSGISRIADVLGVQTGSFAVSINKFKDSYRVDPSGGTSVGGKYGNRDGVLKFDNDPEGAVRAAIANAVQDGAIKGISDASQRILASGKDLEAAITKAALIESVPRDLKAMLDPVGAAVDELNRKWARTVDALKEGGASTEQMAQAQQLYNLQLQQAKNSTATASQTLKDFLAALKLGSNSPYSLRDQEAAAMAKLQPFLDQIAAGKSIDQAAYQAAASTAIDIERQIYGSTKEFFDFLDLVQGTTNKAISAIDNAVPVTAAVESPFASATAASTADTAKNTAAANDLLDQLSQQQAITNQLLARLAAAGGDASGFLSNTRNYA